MRASASAFALTYWAGKDASAASATPLLRSQLATPTTEHITPPGQHAVVSAVELPEGEPAPTELTPAADVLVEGKFACDVEKSSCQPSFAVVALDVTLVQDPSHGWLVSRVNA